MPDTSHSAIAEQLLERRARFATVFAILFIAAQAVGLSQPDAVPPGELQHAAWVIWAAILMLTLVLGGGLLRSPAIRRLLDDESTRQHRTRAMADAFAAGLAAALTLYFIDMFKPVDTGDALRIVVTAAMGCALLRFGHLERQALGGA